MIPSYFAPISHWRDIVNGNIIWDLNQNFTKQTIRNRTYIYGPNKVLKLIIPVKSDSGLKIAFRSFSFEKVPETSADQVDDVAEPPIEPAS